MRTVLPSSRRMRRSEDFARAVRRGRRAGSGTVTVHLFVPRQPTQSPGRIGIVVNRVVGPAVVRNKVKRRLRHLLRDRVDRLAPGSLCVVRARPGSGQTEYARLRHDLDAALARLTGAGT